MDTGLQNEIWAKKIVDALTAQGIDYFCCGPGSRSTTLSLAIASHPKATSSVHFDERGLCFHALGYGKSAQKPAVVMVTSGTAIGNLMPAVMEASNDRIPMIILSADRPPELRDCGANQTVDQVKVFNNFVRWQIDLPCPEPHLSDRYLAAVISQAVLMASYPPAGPVHINCMFREPLFGSKPENVSLTTKVQTSQPILHPSKDTIDYWTGQLSKSQRGVIIVGSSCTGLADAVIPLAKKLNWPVFADILSTLRNSNGHPESICHFDPILKIKSDITIDAVIQFGDRFVSKTLAQWLERQNPSFYLHVTDQSMRNDPMHLATHRVIASPEIFVQELSASQVLTTQTDWIDEWRAWDALCRQKLTESFSCGQEITEPAIIWEIAAFLSEDWNLFLANSMPVRDANQFFFPSFTCGQIFGNRGVSGIDGNLATACGLSKGNKKGTLAVVGDLTFLHDISSLAMLEKSEHPIVICVINNGGGGIFSFLPVSKRKEAFEEFIVATHALHFESAAKLFNIPYFHPQNRLELEELLQTQKSAPRTCIIELKTDRIDNVRVHEHIIKAISTCLNSVNSPSEIPATLH